MREKTARFRALLRTALRWGGRLVALIAVIVIGLIIADILHQKQCHGGASHKGESYEFMGERLTFLNTGQETNGEVLEIDVLFKPTAETNPLKWRDVHVHPNQEERFDVISGAVRFRIGDREETLTAGQTIVGPPNTPHAWSSADGEECTCAPNCDRRYRPMRRLRASCTRVLLKVGCPPFNVRSS